MALDDLSEVTCAEDLYRQGVPSLGKALDMVTHRWVAGARDEGTIVRLLFLLWYRLVEPLHLTGLPSEYEGPSFEKVFESAGGEAGATPLVLWAVGKMAEVSAWAMGEEGKWQEVAPRLRDRARQVRPDMVASDFAGFGAAGDYLRHQFEQSGAMRPILNLTEFRVQYPNVANFLGAWFPDADLEGLEDAEVAKRAASVASPREKERILEQGKMLLAQESFPAKAIGDEANRYFTSEAEAREWLMQTLQTVEEVGPRDQP